MGNARKQFCINLKVKGFESEMDCQIFGDCDKSGFALIVGAAVRAAIIKYCGEPFVEWREDP